MKRTRATTHTSRTDDQAIAYAKADAEATLAFFQAFYEEEGEGTEIMLVPFPSKPSLRERLAARLRRLRG